MSPRRRPAPRLGGQELGPQDAGLLAQVEHARRLEYLTRRAQLAPLPPKAEWSKLAETPWQAQIVRVASTLQFYSYHPHLSKWSARGWPDLSLLGQRGASTPGRALWIECKDDDGVLTEDQVKVIDLMLGCGLEVHVLRPWHGLQYVADVLVPSAAGAERIRYAVERLRPGTA